MDTCTCTAESLHCSPDSTTTLWVGCTPTHTFKVWGKKQPFPESYQWFWVFWILCAHSPFLAPCNKHCTLLHHNLVSVNWFPRGGTRAPPQGCTVVFCLLLPCLCIPSLPWSTAIWTCPWESGKVMEAESVPCKREKQVTQIDFLAQEPHKFLLGFTGSEDIVR